MRNILISVSVLLVVYLPSSILLNSPTLKARDYDAEIEAVNRQIANYNQEATRLSSEADTLSNEVQRLDNERAGIQAQLDLTQAKYDKLQADITSNEKKIAKNQQALGKVIAGMYVSADISPLEMLASSKNITDFVDKQAQKSSVRSSFSKKLNEIKILKLELERQQKEVKQLLDDQTSQRNLLVEKQGEQQKLLNDTKGEESAYRKLSDEANARRQQLEREQQAEIARRYASLTGGAVAGDPGRGGYPNYLATSNYFSPLVDPWGMYSRQCVSYTAWKVYQKNGYMPYWGGRGNANQWPSSARADGIATGSTPRAGSVGVISSGYYGHVVWVESINSDGTINISQYNEYNAGGPGWGNYSERYNVNPAVYDTYIYF